MALGYANHRWLGLATPMILHLWRWHNWRTLKLKLLTSQALLHSIDFRQKNPEKIEVIIKLTAKKSGFLNCIYLTSASILTDAITVRDTEALNAPMLIPISPKKIRRGQTINVKFKYTFGEGYENFKASLQT